MHTTTCTIVLAVAAAAAAATPTFYADAGDQGDLLQFANGNRIESRLRADTGNWDSRLEFDSFPDNGDLTDQISNNINTFQNQTFSFELSFDFAAQQVAWTITDPGSTDHTLVQNVAGFGNVNIIQLFTVGSRGEVDVENLEFNGLGLSVNAFPDIDTNPVSPRFSETFLFFGDSFDLLTGDWSLTGDLTFGTFTDNNPSEGSKITIKLREGFLIPAPTAAAPLALAGLLATRRRR